MLFCKSVSSFIDTSRVESYYGVAAGQTSWQYQLQEFVHGIEMKQLEFVKRVRGLC
jgi:hypothetical protein